MCIVKLETRFYKNDRNKVVNPVKWLIAAEGISQMLEGIFFRVGWVDRCYDPEFIRAFTYHHDGSYYPMRWGGYSCDDEYLEWWKNLPLWAKVKMIQDAVSLMDENFDLPADGGFDVSSRGNYLADLIKYIESSHVLGEVVDNLTIAR